MGCHLLLQGIFPTKGSNRCLLCLLHWQVDSLPIESPGQKVQIGQNSLLPLLKSQEQKQSPAHVPCTNQCQRRWANHLSQLFTGHTPGHTPTLTPYKNQLAHPAQGAGEGTCLLLFNPSCFSRGPNKALPEMKGKKNTLY